MLGRPHLYYEYYPGFYYHNYWDWREKFLKAKEFIKRAEPEKNIDSYRRKWCLDFITDEYDMIYGCSKGTV